MTRHLKLLERYAQDLAVAKATAEAWWRSLLQPEAAVPGGSAELQNAQLAKRWPWGAASHPVVLGVVRKYWLACDAVNQSLEPLAAVETAEPLYTLALDDEGDEAAAAEIERDSFVDPHIFISEWLTDSHEELAVFVGRLPYWPIGLDSQERYT